MDALKEIVDILNKSFDSSLKLIAVTKIDQLFTFWVGLFAEKQQVNSEHQQDDHKTLWIKTSIKGWLFCDETSILCKYCVLI